MQQLGQMRYVVGTPASVTRKPVWLLIRRLRVQSQLGRQHSFIEIDHEIFSTVIPSFLWFKKGSCQFLAKECAQYWLTA